MGGKHPLGQNHITLGCYGKISTSLNPTFVQVYRGTTLNSSCDLAQLLISPPLPQGVPEPANRAPTITAGMRCRRMPGEGLVSTIGSCLNWEFARDRPACPSINQTTSRPSTSSLGLDTSAEKGEPVISPTITSSVLQLAVNNRPSNHREFSLDKSYGFISTALILGHA